MTPRLLHNALANFFGAAVPALVALATVPLVVKGLGEGGYGVYALVTAIAGYFAVVDINVTAGSVKYIAAFAARRDAARIGETVCFGMLVYTLLGMAGGAGLYLAAHWLVTRAFAVPPALAADAVVTLKAAAFGFLAGQLQAYLQSVPQALLRYDVSGRLEIGFGVALPLATVGVLLLGGGLFDVMLLRVAASVLHCLLLWRVVRRLLPDLAWRWPGAPLRRALLGFSAYAFLSRVAALSYAYADKLIVGALAGVAALAWFTVAATLANRILGLNYRLCAVFFPAASALAAGAELARLKRAYLDASRYLTYLNLAMLVLVAVFAAPILRYWMDAGFARHGATVLALMAASQCIDALTNLPTLVNDGVGHPRVSGLFAVARAGVGLPAVYVGVAWAGIDGAAWGHVIASLLLSTAFLVYVHGRTVPASCAELFAHAYAPGLPGAAAIALAAALGEHYLDRGARDFALLLCATAAALLLYGMRFVLGQQARDQARIRLAGWRA